LRNDLGEGGLVWLLRSTDIHLTLHLLASYPNTSTSFVLYFSDPDHQMDRSEICICMEKAAAQSQIGVGTKTRARVQYMNQHLGRPRRTIPMRSRSPDTQHSSRCSNSFVKCNRRVLRISAGCRCPRGVRGSRRREKNRRTRDEEAVVVSAVTQLPSNTDEPEERGRRVLRIRPGGICRPF
jgi:hypothetical protein